MNGKYSWLAVSLFLSLLAGCQVATPAPVAAPQAALSQPVLVPPTFLSQTFTIADYGAVGDGKTSNTDAFAKAITTCSTAGGGHLVVPPGTYLTGPIHLMSGVDLHLQKGATILFSRSFDDYPLIITNFEGKQTVECTSPLSGDNLHDVAVTGEGIIDGQGDAWRMVKKSKLTDDQWNALVQSGGVVDESGQTWYPSESARDGLRGLTRLRASGQPPRIDDYRPYRDLLRPSLVCISNSQNILLDGNTFRNSPCWNVHLLYSDNITVHNVTVFNPYYAQNGDGIDIDSCRNVNLSDSNIEAGDDVICLKSGRDAEGRLAGRPTENVTITDCVLGHGHGGIAIGSEMSGDVRNVFVSNCTLRGTDDGLRFKSVRGRGGVVENIHIRDIHMSDIKKSAIAFDMFYMVRRPTGGTDDASPLDVRQTPPQPVDEGTPRFRDIFVSNVDCQGAQIAMQLRGLPEMPLQGVTLENVKITASAGGAIVDASDIVLRDLDIQCTASPALQFQDVRNLTLQNVTGIPQQTQRVTQLP
jgi:polygalacturonase